MPDRKDGKSEQCGTCKFFEPYGTDSHGFCGHLSGWSIFPDSQKGEIRVVDVDGCGEWRAVAKAIAEPRHD